MNSSIWLHRLILWPTTIATLYAVSACAAGPEVVDHSFEFDASVDSPGITVLDYRYGDSKIPGARSNPDYIQAGRPLQGTSITGPMRRGDSLWVKWKVNADGKIYEDTVDLKKRLPRNIEDHIVYFKVDGMQLYVYLISPEYLKSGEQSTGPRNYRFRKATVVYPNQNKK
jgi:hypothetical protein